jgi:ATP-dependent Clp protease ATP-binding subunit ClpC
LDEIEKAHPDVFNILLQIFDDGHLTDAKGRRVDFRNTIIIMTSNIGSDLIKRDGSLGFAVKSDEAQSVDQQYTRMKDKVVDEMKRFFRPEFLNRIDGTVVFHPLDKEHILQIVDIVLEDVAKNLTEKNLTLEVTQEAKVFLAENGFDPTFGARPLRRIIQDTVENKLSDEILAGHFNDNDTILVTVEEDEIVVRSKNILVTN